MPIPRPLGQSLSLNADQLDQAAEVTTLDIAVAVLAWQMWAPLRYKDLLDAESGEAVRHATQARL